MLSTFFNISDLTRKDFENILDISPSDNKLNKKNIGMLFKNILLELDSHLLLA